MRERKESGVEWIGEIPSHWEVMPNKRIMKKKKEVCPQYQGEDILSLTMNGVIVRDLNAGGKMPTTFDGYQRLAPGNLLMCLFDIDVTPRCIGLIKNEGLSSPAYSQFVVNEKGYAPYYYYYYLNLDHTKELLHMAKNLRHSLTEDQLGEIGVAVPPYAEQIRIVETLEEKLPKVDTLIANVQAQIEKLKAYKQSVITETVTKGLDPTVPMKDSGVEWIGEIPEHWHYIKSFYVYDKIGDIDHYMPESVTEGYPYVMTGDLQQVVSVIDFDRCKKISEEEYRRLSKKIAASKGDIIFARYATIGTVCYVDVEKEFLVSYSCVTIKPKHSMVVGKYLWYYYQSFAFLEDVKKLINANTQANVGMESLYRAKIVIPPYSEQEDIIGYLDKKCNYIDRLIAIKQSKIEKLEQYKKSLIYEYVTGKKEVS